MSAPSASELLHWGDLEGRRRRAARGTTGLLSWPPIVALALSVLLGLELWRRTTLVDPNIGPIGFSLFAIAFAEILTVFGTPYRMYWRDDSALLARLAIDGGTLFELAYRRCFRAAGLALLPAVAAVVVIATQGFAEVALRLGVVAIAGAVLAGALAPAASLAGGAIVASDKAQAMIDSFGGETKPPGVTWLGALPGLVAMAVALLLMTTRDWIIGIDPFVSTGLFTCIAAIVAAAAAFLWAVRAAPEILIDAQREVAALDQVRLAHIDRSHAGPIERLWGALTCRSQSARLVYNKDAALMRRRYPAPYFVAVSRHRSDVDSGGDLVRRSSPCRDLLTRGLRSRHGPQTRIAAG